MCKQNRVKVNKLRNKHAQGSAKTGSPAPKTRHSQDKTPQKTAKPKPTNPQTHPDAASSRSTQPPPAYTRNTRLPTPPHALSHLRHWLLQPIQIFRLTNAMGALRAGFCKALAYVENRPSVIIHHSTLSKGRCDSYGVELCG